MNYNIGIIGATTEQTTLLRRACEDLNVNLTGYYYIDETEPQDGYFVCINAMNDMNRANSYKKHLTSLNTPCMLLCIDDDIRYINSQCDCTFVKTTNQHSMNNVIKEMHKLCDKDKILVPTYNIGVIGASAQQFAYLQREFKPMQIKLHKSDNVQAHEGYLICVNDICTKVHTFRYQREAGDKPCLMLFIDEKSKDYLYNVAGFDYFYVDSKEENALIPVNNKLMQLFNKNKIISKTDEDGNMFHYCNDVLHNENDLPACVYANGTKKWYNQGRLSRIGDLASIICDDALYWYEDGQLHRDNDLPAIMYRNGPKYWYVRGELHREEDRPAAEFTNGTKKWFCRGELHRGNNLPAIMDANNNKEWYKNDVRYYPLPPCTQEPITQFNTPATSFIDDTITLPTINLPTITLPNAPTINLPSMNLPPVTLPTLTNAPTNLPTKNTAIFTLPTLTNAPNVNLLTINNPLVSLPTMIDLPTTPVSSPLKSKAKRPTSAYIMYLSDNRQRINRENPKASYFDMIDIGRNEWINESPHVKAEYEALAAKDVIRYEQVVHEIIQPATKNLYSEIESYLQEHKQQIKEDNPWMVNKDVINMAIEGWNEKRTIIEKYESVLKQLKDNNMFNALYDESIQRRIQAIPFISEWSIDDDVINSENDGSISSEEDVDYQESEDVDDVYEEEFVDEDVVDDVVYDVVDVVDVVDDVDDVVEDNTSCSLTAEHIKEQLSKHCNVLNQLVKDCEDIFVNAKMEEDIGDYLNSLFMYINDDNYEENVIYIKNELCQIYFTADKATIRKLIKKDVEICNLVKSINTIAMTDCDAKWKCDMIQKYIMMYGSKKVLNNGQ